jgi:hypothetical protein
MTLKIQISLPKASILVKLYNSSKAQNIASGINADHSVTFRIIRVTIRIRMLNLDRVDT